MDCLLVLRLDLFDRVPLAERVVVALPDPDHRRRHGRVPAQLHDERERDAVVGAAKERHEYVVSCAALECLWEATVPEERDVDGCVRKDAPDVVRVRSDGVMIALALLLEERVEGRCAGGLVGSGGLSSHGFD